MTIAIEHLKLSELLAYLHEQEEESFPELKDEKLLNMLAEKWQQHAEFCTYRDESRQLVGMIAFYANLQETKVAYITRVYVDKQYRGKGLFSDMFLLLKNTVKIKGVRLIRLEVDKNNKKAQKAYRKNGFSYTEDTHNNSIYMEYILIA